ncbi:MAG: hypothetical protein R3C03_03640 [Pirellulaceae bacterium]
MTQDHLYLKRLILELLGPVQPEPQSNEFAPNDRTMQIRKRVLSAIDDINSLRLNTDAIRIDDGFDQRLANWLDGKMTRDDTDAFEFGLIRSRAKLFLAVSALICQRTKIRSVTASSKFTDRLLAMHQVKDSFKPEEVISESKLHDAARCPMTSTEQAPAIVTTEKQRPAKSGWYALRSKPLLLTSAATILLALSLALYFSNGSTDGLTESSVARKNPVNSDFDSAEYQTSVVTGQVDRPSAAIDDISNDSQSVVTDRPQVGQEKHSEMERVPSPIRTNDDPQNAIVEVPSHESDNSVPSPASNDETIALKLGPLFEVSEIVGLVATTNQNTSTIQGILATPISNSRMPIQTLPGSWLKATFNQTSTLIVDSESSLNVVRQAKFPGLEFQLQRGRFAIRDAPEGSRFMVRSGTSSFLLEALEPETEWGIESIADSQRLFVKSGQLSIDNALVITEHKSVELISLELEAKRYNENLRWFVEPADRMRIENQDELLKAADLSEAVASIKIPGANEVETHFLAMNIQMSLDPVVAWDFLQSDNAAASENAFAWLYQNWKTGRRREIERILVGKLDPAVDPGRIFRLLYQYETNSQLSQRAWEALFNQLQSQHLFQRVGAKILLTNAFGPNDVGYSPHDDMQTLIRKSSAWRRKVIAQRQRQR